MIIAATILSITAMILFGWSRKCRHEWEIVRAERMYGFKEGIKYILRCTKCGKMKQVTL